jgi:hypothetical protein
MEKNKMLERKTSDLEADLQQSLRLLSESKPKRKTSDISVDELPFFPNLEAELRRYLTRIRLTLKIF